MSAKRRGKIGHQGGSGLRPRIAPAIKGKMTALRLFYHVREAASVSYTHLDVYKRKEPERVAQEVEDIIGIPCMDAPRISAKTGENIQAVLERVVSCLLYTSNQKPQQAQRLVNIEAVGNT